LKLARQFLIAFLFLIRFSAHAEQSDFYITENQATQVRQPYCAATSATKKKLNELKSEKKKQGQTNKPLTEKDAIKIRIKEEWSEYKDYMKDIGSGQGSCNKAISDCNDYGSMCEQHLDKCSNSDNNIEKIKLLELAIECRKTQVGKLLNVIKALKGKHFDWQIDLKKYCNVQKDIYKNHINSLNANINNIRSIEKIKPHWNSASSKAQQAAEKKNSFVYNPANSSEVSDLLNAVAQLYEEASEDCQRGGELANNDEYRNVLRTTKDYYDSSAKECRNKAKEWPEKISAQKESLYSEFNSLKEEGALLEAQNKPHDCHDTYTRLAAILQVLTTNGEQVTDEVARCHEKLTTLNAAADARRLTDPLSPSLQELFHTKEVYNRDQFYHGKTKNIKIKSEQVIPLDGQNGILYAGQYYRYLVQRKASPLNLRVVVSENGTSIHEESIAIPTTSALWDNYISVDEMLLVPDTVLRSNFGLDLRLTVVFDPYNSFSLVIGQKGSSAKYDFTFFLDDEHLYDVHFTHPLPWQLEVLRKPEIPSATPLFSLLSIDDIEHSREKNIQSSHPILDQFVKDMKGNPISLAQFVYNEIENFDSFLYRDNGVFQAPAIHRNPSRTFLEKQGSPWEQCALLVYLLQQAGYEAQYIEGICTLPAPFVEKLLFIQLPEEQEILLNYPGVLVSCNGQSHKLFPWMKEMSTIEGHDIYSFMPEEYGNADRWLKHYLCNDEKILKNIGPDGNDTVGVLFVRFVEEQLRSRGLSLHDVGSHRVLHKKQFNAWQDFPCPTLKNHLNVFANLSSRNDLFATINIEINSEETPSKKISTREMRLADISCQSHAIYFSQASESEYILHLCLSDNWTDEQTMSLDATDQNISIKLSYCAPMSPTLQNHQMDQFSLAKGTCAALCYSSGGANTKVTSYFAEQFAKKEEQYEKLNALFSFVGTAYFEKCSKAEKILASLHKISPDTYFSVGLAKLSPDHHSISDLRFPQVDMHRKIVNMNQKYTFSPYKETNSAFRQYHILTNADASSNEHQVLREIYQDRYAISTVKLLQIAHKKHQKKGNSGPGFLVFTAQSFADTEANIQNSHLLHYFLHLGVVDFSKIKNIAPIHWEQLQTLFTVKDSAYAYAYMTPEPVSSEDGFGLMPPSYSGIGTLINSGFMQVALISDGFRVMNGGYGSRLTENFTKAIIESQCQLVSNGNSYSLHHIKNPSSLNAAGSYQLPDFAQKKSETDSLWNNTQYTPTYNDRRKTDEWAERKYLPEYKFNTTDIPSSFWNKPQWSNSSNNYIRTDEWAKRSFLPEYKFNNTTMPSFSWNNLQSIFSNNNPIKTDGWAEHKLLPGCISNNTKSPLFWWNNPQFTSFNSQLKSDVRPDHKFFSDSVADPVDVVTGAFYIDEVDLYLPGVFPLEIRRNYSSQNSQPGLFGFGWKLSLNPYLIEEENKLYASEKDGTLIVYRLDEKSKRWVILPEDNPELRNFNKQGIGGSANPFHAYIEKAEGYILYGVDGSKRVFENMLLKTWSDHAGNTLTFSYDNERIKQIESSSGGLLGFEYNHNGRISEAYAKDGRRISYTYDSRGDLASVTLPNSGTISYDYDHFHRIIRETKPHGRVLENIYDDEGRVRIQRAPVGVMQAMIPNAEFIYNEGSTTVIDAAGSTTEYKYFQKQIYKITDPEGNKTYHSWFIDENTYFDAEIEQILPWNQSGAHPRCLKSSTDKRGLTTNYIYDSKGNAQEIFLVGNDLTGKDESSVSKRFRYNDINLCVLEETLNTKTLTTYDITFSRLPKRIEKYTDDTLTYFMDLEYTSHGQLSKENLSGAVTLWEYDERDFPKTKIQKTGTDDPDVVTSFYYNEQGQCIDLISADTVIHNKYDIMGNKYCSTIELKSGKIISTTYARHDFNNETVWQQGDDLNNIVFLDYNAMGLLKATRRQLTQANGSIAEPSGIAYTLYEYNACGYLIEEVDALGNCTYNNYDALGRVKCTTKEGLSTRFTYETGGLIASITSPSGAITSRQYTTNGLLKSEIYPDGTHALYIYDFFGRPIQETKNNSVQTISYDDATHQVTRTHGDISVTQTFDSRGNIICSKNAAGYSWIKTYDGLNRLKTEMTPNGDITTWNYNDDTIVCTLPSGEKIIQRYEAGALVESQTISQSGNVITHSCYNRYLDKSIIEEIHGDITTTTLKNTQGLPIRIQQGDNVVTHHYDAQGNCIASVDAEGHITHHEYDGLGRLKKKTLPDGAIINYDYDLDSNLNAYHMPGGLTWKCICDSMGRKISEELQSGKQTSQHWEFKYEDGRLKQAIDPLARIHTYKYDSYSRLIEQSVGKDSRIYTYDSRGLLTSATESGAYTSKIERSYNASGRITQEKIFLNGKLLQQTEQDWTPSSRSLQIGEHKRHYDYECGHLKNLSAKDVNLSYEYGKNGSLIRKTTPFTDVDIQYDASAFPQSIDVCLHGNAYQETLNWTPSGKLSTHESTYPESQAASYSYTSRGFLKSAQDQSYIFDFDMPGRGIRTSAPNRDVLERGLDVFGKIVKENHAKGAYTTGYDAMGQVFSYGKDQLTWDSWGRLIAVTSSTYVWEASYDALGRRLQTNYTPLTDYYLFKRKGKSVITTSFYDPEQEFQEIGVVCGDSTFWKLQNNTCDAIIDSSGDNVTLHHDVVGNLIAVVTSEEILWNNDYPTPYGPQNTPSHEVTLQSYALSLAWQNKRVDPTGFIWLGARYYDPKGGRFLSPDPISHPACLDLYAYANGDPINNIDPDGRCPSPAYETVPATNINSRSSLPQVSSYDEMVIFGANNYSRRYDLSDLGRQEPPKGLRIGWTNGIMNSYSDARKSAMYLSDLSGGCNIYGTYGATYGLRNDIVSCNLALNYIDTGRVRHMHNEWNDFLDKNPEAYYLHFCHSRGAIDTRNALLMYSEEKRKRIIVVAIAPAAYIYEETCAKVIHYRVSSSRDPIPYIDIMGAERAKHTIVTLSSHKNAPWHDHEFTSKTYRKFIKDNCDDYLELMRK